MNGVAIALRAFLGWFGDALGRSYGCSNTNSESMLWKIVCGVALRQLVTAQDPAV